MQGNGGFGSEAKEAQVTKTDKTLALSRAFMQKHGFKFLTRGAIACWGEAIDGKAMSNENIRLIEERALRKLRRYGIFKVEDLAFVCRANRSPCWKELA